MFNNSVAKGIRSVDTASWNNKLNLRDTLRMLRPYLRAADTASLSNRLNQKVDLNQLNTNTLTLDGKINIADTANMLANYRLGINAKVNIADTADMLTPYLRNADTTGMLTNYRTGINAKVNIADTSAMLASYRTGLNDKAPINNPTFTGTVSGITQTMVGLPNVNNTSDANKPISTATQTALDLKANTADLTSISGNASTATKLAAPKNINGVPFDGSADITVPADANTISGTVAVAKGGTGATTAADARTNLGLGIGTDVLAQRTFGSAANSTASDFVAASEKGANNGVASLGNDGKIPSVQIPAVSFQSATVVSSQADMLALTSAVIGSIAIRTDDNKNYVLSALPATTLANWIQLATPTSVTSVNGFAGPNVVLTAANINGAELSSNKSNDMATDAMSTTKYPSVKVIKEYVDQQSANAGVADNSITSSKINGTVAVAKGGTGATTAAEARTNLGLGIGTDVLAQRTFGSAANSTASDFVAASEKGANNGVATLGNDGKIPSVQIPAVSFQSATVVSSQAAMLALSNAVIGSIAIRTDDNKNYVLSALPATTLANWIQLATPTSVTSVNGFAGPNVVLTAANINGAEDISNKSNDIATDATSTTKYPSVKVIKEYVDQQSANAGVADNSITSSKINGTIEVAKGGTGATTAADARTNLGLAIGTDVMAAGAATTLTGEVTGTGSGTFATSLSASGVTAGTYGSSTAIPTFTVDAKGRLTAAGTVGLTAGVNIVDTAAMLLPYLRDADTTGMLLPYLRLADTVTMLANYRAGINAKVNIADTSAMLTSYRTGLNEKAPINNPTFTGTVGGITQSMVGLPNVDNTSDAIKPVSTAAQTAINTKAPINNPTFTGTVGGITQSMVGLSNVDNTSDANKPVSTAAQTALNTKAPINNPTFTGTVLGIDKTMVGLPNVDNTSDANKPVSTAAQTALNTKLNILDTAAMLEPYLREPESPVNGDILFYNNNKWANLPKGQEGQLLIMSNGQPTWTSVSSASGPPMGASATAGNTQATVSFSAPVYNGGSAISLYTVTSNPTGGIVTGSSSPIIVTGLTNGISYTFTVIAMNAVGSSVPSAASAAVIPVTIPGAPTSVVATAGNTTASVAFIAPTDTGGNAITGYTVTSSGGSAVVTATGTTSPISVTGLTNGTSYTFTVVATNAVGSSAPSSASAAVTPATIPDAPTNVVATAGNASASVAFSAPSDTGGNAITGYTVTSNPATSPVTGTTSPINVTGLTNGTSYTFTVVATNAVGSSAPSSASTAVTPVTLPTISTTAISGITVTGANSGGNVTSDGGASVTSRGGVWSTLTNPTVALTTKTTNGTGTGSFTSALTPLTGGTTYYVRAYATNSVNTAYGSQMTFTTTSACGTSIKDVDNNDYNTVLIGTQCWTNKNLKVTKYNDGTAIPLNNTYTSGTVSTVWANLATGAYTIYANELSSGPNATNYGFLYNWYAAKGIVTTGSTTYKNLCPTGYHVPTDAEWSTLTTFLGGESVAGNKMKITGTTFWNDCGQVGTNSNGFTGLPGGFRLSDGSFSDIGISAVFWSVTEASGSNAWNRFLSNCSDDVFRYNDGNSRYYKLVGASVRCLKD